MKRAFNKFSRLRLRTRILVGLFFIFSIFFSVSIYTFGLVQNISEIPLKMYKHPFAVSNSVRDIHKSLADMQLFMFRILTGHTEDYANAQAHNTKTVEAIRSHFDLIGERFLGDKAEISAAREEFEKAVKIMDEIFAHINKGEFESAGMKLFLFNEACEAQVFSRISYLLEFADKKGMEFNDIAVANRKKFTTSLSLVLVLGFLLSFILFRFILNSVDQKLKTITESLSSNLTDTRAISRKLMQASQTLASTMEEQHHSLQQSNDDLQEISSVASNNAEYAKLSAQSSNRCLQASGDGKQAISQLKEAIDSIKSGHNLIKNQFEKEKQEFNRISNFIMAISEKLQIINSIVFQTRLLSFNASVEAARAGENGKGFAVVAEEVGSLAKLTGTAAKEINQLVSDSTAAITEIVEGSEEEIDHVIESTNSSLKKVVDRTKNCEEIFDTIDDFVKENSNMVHSIASAGEEQRRQIQSISSVFNTLGEISDLGIKNSSESQTLSLKVQAGSNKIGDSLKCLRELVIGVNSDEDEFGSGSIEDENRLAS